MKLIIAGSRNISDAEIIIDVMAVEELAIMYLQDGKLEMPEEVVNGGCWGVDMAGVTWAERYSILIKTFPPDWTRYGKSAGPIRNEQMAEYADALLAIWDGESKGTFDMIKKADKHGLEMLVITVGEIK